MKRKRWLLLAAALILLVRVVPAEERMQTVYVIGKPDQSPVEYYDEEAGEYRGILPALLKEAGEKCGVNIYYLPPDRDRLRQAKNLQGEIYSCWEPGEENPALTPGPVLLEYPYESGERGYGIAYTGIAGEELRQKLNEALASIPPRERERILLEETGHPAKGGPWRYLVMGCLLLLCIALGMWVKILLSRIRRQERRARTDLATGGLRIDAMREELKQQLGHVNRILYAAAVVEIENFDSVCELYGVRQGASVLRSTGEAIQGWLEERELSARLFGNQFVVLMHFGTPQIAAQRLRDLMERIHSQVRRADGRSFVVLRCGVYRLSPKDGELEEMILRADQAKRYARLKEQDFVVATPEILKEMEGERLLEEEALKAFDQDEFVPYFQPKVLLSSGRIVGAEVLTRWHSRKRGLLFPGQFIPILEENHQIERLDLMMFRRVCNFLAGQKEGRIPKVSCNFSRVCFTKENFAGTLREIANEEGVPTQCLDIEITESVATGDRSRTHRLIQELKSCGFTISLDDFGSGYSSLADIQELMPDSIKIDQSLVRNLFDEKVKSMVGDTIQMAHHLGADVVCEGVESREEAEILKTLGCDVIQGYYFYQPMPYREFIKLFPDQED